MIANTLRADVLSATKGDRKAFGRLVDTSRGLVCSIVLAIVRDVAASEDVAQEVFLAAWSGLGNLRNPDSFLPWLRQMARNRAFDWLRSRARTPVDADPDRLLAAADPMGTPERQLLCAEERRIVADAIDSLPDDAREVVTLYYREGRSAAQVAALLDVQEDAVKKRLSRAREALREAASRLEDALVRTAPGDAFTNAVLIGLPVGLPGAGAGAALGGGKLAKLLALGGGAAAGLAGAVGGILFQRRSLLKRARDEEERRGIRALVWAQVGVVLAALVGWRLVPATPLATGLVTLGYVISFLALLHGWYPRIIARRLAAERAEDPTAAARQRRRKIIGMILAPLMVAYVIAATLSGLHP